MEATISYWIAPDDVPRFCREAVGRSHPVAPCLTASSACDVGTHQRAENGKRPPFACVVVTYRPAGG